MAKEPTISPLRAGCRRTKGRVAQTAGGRETASASASAAEEGLIGGHDSISGAYFATRLSSDATRPGQRARPSK